MGIIGLKQRRSSHFRQNRCRVTEPLKTAVGLNVPPVLFLL